MDEDPVVDPDQCYSASGLTLISFALTFFFRPATSWTSNNESHGAHWPGWANIEYMIIFGDSYTTTGFNSSGVQPSLSNPLGNPAYPGQTSSNGPCWVDFLTTVHNQSLIRTANLAYGGATLDPDLKSANLPGTLSLREQINDEYLPVYSSHPATFNWNTETTLFAVWIGINDVHDSEPYNYQTLDVIFNMYRGLVEKLYTSGARNLLFVNVPPLERAPNVVRGGEEEQRVHRSNVDLWNKNLTMLADNLHEAHPDLTTFLFDANKLFNEVIENSCSYAETCPYKNTTWYCDYCTYLQTLVSNLRAIYSSSTYLHSSERRTLSEEVKKSSESIDRMSICGTRILQCSPTICTKRILI
nr:acetylesterase [Quercus suber]